jgi:arginine decarboxylase-like protein
MGGIFKLNGELYTTTNSDVKYTDEWKKQVEEICSKSEIADMLQEVGAEKEEYKTALKYFINRVDEGTARSKTTYKMFKDLIEKYEQ